MPALAGDVHCIAKLLQVMDPGIPSGDLVPTSMLMFHQGIRPVSSQTEECHLSTKETPSAPLGQNCTCSPKMLQRNVDNFSFPPVIKDKLLITFGLGDHPFGLFIFL